MQTNATLSASDIFRNVRYRQDCFKVSIDLFNFLKNIGMDAFVVWNNEHVWVVMNVLGAMMPLETQLFGVPSIFSISPDLEKSACGEAGTHTHADRTSRHSVIPFARLTKLMRPLVNNAWVCPGGSPRSGARNLSSPAWSQCAMILSSVTWYTCFILAAVVSLPVSLCPRPAYRRPTMI